MMGIASAPGRSEAAVPVWVAFVGQVFLGATTVLAQTAHLETVRVFRRPLHIGYWEARRSIRAVGTPTGDLYVLFPGSDTVRALTPDGSLILSRPGAGSLVGRTGIGRLGATRGGIFTIDRAEHVIRHFDFAGAPIDSGTVVPIEMPAPFSPAIPSTVLADGSVVALPGVTASLLGRGISSVPLVRASQGGEVLETIGAVPVGGGVLLVPRGRDTTLVTVADVRAVFDGAVKWTVDDDGSLLVALVDRRPESGGWYVRVARVRSGGRDTTVLHRFAAQRHLVPVEVADSVVEAKATKLGVAPAEMRGMLSLPDAYPPISAIRKGVDGTIWLRREHVPGSPVRWDVLTSRGVPLGFVQLPFGLWPLSLSADGIWAIEGAVDNDAAIVRWRVGEG